MEKTIGPTISVSTSGFYITGYSTDTVSGTAGYCYNTSTSAPSKSSYTSVTNRPTSKYTASQYHVTSSNTYRFHAIDTAGNHNYGSTSYITYYKYHCNYCNQDTDSLHYNCPTHYETQSCSLNSSPCTATYKCNTELICAGTYQKDPHTIFCAICGLRTYTRYYDCSKLCPNCHASNIFSWCASHGDAQTLKCGANLSCSLYGSPNYSNN